MVSCFSFVGFAQHKERQVIGIIATVCISPKIFSVFYSGETLHRSDRIRESFSFWATVCETVRPMLSDRCLSVCLSVCLSCLSVTFVHCGQTVVRIKIKLGVQVGLGPGHIALDGDPAPHPPKGHRLPPQFSAHICCGQMAAWIKMSLGPELGLGRGNFVLDGDPAPLPKMGGGAPRPKFSAHVYCGQTAGWMKLVLGMEVGLCPSDFVLDGDQPLPQKGAEPPSSIFGPFLL